jgi:ribosomal protein S18 acetylase RimI-like enzyme
MPEPQVTYRPMAATDIAAARYIGRAASDALGAETNVPRRTLEPSTSPWLHHMLRTSPECCWVADAGFPIGFAMGFVRGDVWYLSQLFVYLDFQASGAGKELLARSMAAGRAAGARVFAVVASESLAAQSLYTRSGMAARGLFYRLEGPTASLLDLPPPEANRKRVVDCAGWLDQIAALDTQVWGAERRIDHEHYLSDDSLDGGEQSAFALTRDGVLAGYGYAYKSPSGIGYVAPLAAALPQEQPALLHMAGEWLSDRSVETVRAAIVSHNTTAIEALLEAGWRITGSNVFMTSQPFGQFDRYIPAGGASL